MYNNVSDIAMKKIIYIDMDGVLCDFNGGYAEYKKKNPVIQYPQSQYGFFRRLKPIKDAIESVDFLNAQKQFDIYFLSAPSVKNPLSYTEKRLWIEDFFNVEMANKLILSSNKGLNKGDYLIDDCDSGKGQEDFEGKLLLFGGDEFPDWKTIIGYFVNEFKLKAQ